MRKIGKIGYCTLASLLALDIALAGNLGKRVAEYMMPHPQRQEQVKYSKDQEILAKVIFGEARGASKELKKAVAHTVLNRVRDSRWSSTIEGVVFQPYQFSCFNKNDPNHAKVKNPEKYEPEAWRACLETAGEVLEGKTKDPTDGATHYHTDRVSPKWSRDKKHFTKIDNTLFFE